jgi:N-acylglucosamine-6-phosphate 2-epimerase
VYVIDKLRGGLIVSCQAASDSPLRHSLIMRAMAEAAEEAGAVGIRADGPEDIAAIRAAVQLPIIGIYKQQRADVEVYITPTLDAAREVVRAGADLIAVDATHRPHPGGQSGADLVRQCKRHLDAPVMADISTLEEGIAAEEAGADLLGTTLAGYTPYSRQLVTPDFQLVEDLVRAVSIPVIAEGRVGTPEDAVQALRLGAYAVVVGAAITQPGWIARRFVEALRLAAGQVA